MSTAFPFLRLPLVAALLLWAGACEGRAADGAIRSTPEYTIVGYRNIWNLQGEARTRPQRFQIDAIVHYYDPQWRQLWGQDGDTTFYLEPREPLPIKSGQLVRLTGISRPERFWEVEALSAVVLEEHPATTAWPVTGRLTDFAALNERLIEVEGVVDNQRLVDTNHLRLLLLVEGYRVEAVLWLETGSPIPQYAGLPVRVRGVYHTQLDADKRLQSIELAVPDQSFIELRGPASSSAAPAAELPATSATEQLKPIVGYRNLWNLQGRAHERPQHFQCDVVVLHYDPHWRHLWAQEGDTTFFLVAPPKRLPIRAGQLVRLDGVTTPATFSQVTQLEATVLAPDPPFAPLPADGRLHDSATLNEHLVQLEGFVESQSLFDAHHLRCVLIAEGLRAEVFIWLDTESVAPLLTGQVVRLEAVYGSRLRPDGQLDSITLVVPGPERITVKHSLRNDPRFALPPTRVERLPQAPATALLHVAGRVVGLEPGVSLSLRDETGQLDVLTPQEHGLRVGDNVEAIGFPAIIGARWLLRHGLVRADQPTGVGNTTGPRRLIRVARQVLELAPASAAGGQAVQLQGVVTWSAPGASFLFLQDASAGIRVEWTDASLTAPPPGTGISVQGTSTMGDFAPAVQATRFVMQFLMSPPEPRRISLDEARSGMHEAAWVECKGLLRAAEPDGRYTRLLIATDTGDFEALAPAGAGYAAQRGSFVAARGVCNGLANSQHQLTGIRLWAPSPDCIVVEESPPADLFALPENPIASLRQFGLLQSTTHWFRTSGTVVYHAPGHDMILQDGPDVLTVTPDDDRVFAVGERVEVAGVHGRDGARLVLRHAGVRPLGAGPPLRPESLPHPLPLDSNLDSHLVRLSGTLDEVTELDGERLLEIRHPAGALVARIIGDPGEAVPATWRRGSEVELTGIYRLKLDEHRRATGFELLLRSPADLRIVRSAPWWTSQRARNLTYIAAACVAVAFLWVAALRRKVRQQTAQLRRQIDKEAHLEAELERARRVEALGTLAGGIAHDFNNLLTVILGNLSFALLDQRIAALARDPLTEAQASAERARDLVQQMLTFSRGGEPIREAFALEPLVRESAMLALSGSSARAEIIPADLLPDVWADRLQVRRALLNLLARAIPALPQGGTISVALAAEMVGPDTAGPLATGTYVRLELTDHGEVIPTEQLAALFDPYAAAAGGADDDRFGMATAFSIAQKHGGHLGVRSQTGAGTTFTLWLPAAPAHVAPSPARTTAVATHVHPRLRVLLMDDEPGVRHLGEKLLRHLGHDPITVPDGAACVTAYRAAIDERRPFDLVVLDLTIAGGMGGRETLLDLRKIDPMVCAIVSSGYSGDAVLAHHREHGFAAAVPKPYEIERLAAAITEALAEDLVL
ncbi:MAG TPA: ATP-binding protein [Opitutaceae bacterium]|nr:ATP-binding protein [Opitutaceae bacterium]